LSRTACQRIRDDDGRPVGGTIGIPAHSASKPTTTSGALGDGGAIVTNDADWLGA